MNLYFQFNVQQTVKINYIKFKFYYIYLNNILYLAPLYIRQKIIVNIINCSNFFFFFQSNISMILLNWVLFNILIDFNRFFFFFQSNIFLLLRLFSSLSNFISFFPLSTLYFIILLLFSFFWVFNFKYIIIKIGFTSISSFRNNFNLAFSSKFSLVF